MAENLSRECTISPKYGTIPTPTNQRSKSGVNLSKSPNWDSSVFRTVNDKRSTRPLTYKSNEAGMDRSARKVTASKNVTEFLDIVKTPINQPRYLNHTKTSITKDLSRTKAVIRNCATVKSMEKFRQAERENPII
jgi:hypothetical protein